MPSIHLLAPLRACALAAAFLTLGLPAARAAEPIPAGHFFNNKAFSGAVLSPDAKLLAVRFSNDNTRDRLAVVDLGTNTLKIVAQFAQRDVNRFQWVNNERLVFDSTDKSVGPGDARFGPGLYAVNRDGSNFKQLVHIHGNAVQEHLVGKTILPANHFLVQQVGSQDSDEVYVTHPKRRGQDEDGDVVYENLMRLNTLTGRAETVQRPGDAHGWLLDHKGQPRLCITTEKNIETVHYLDPATGQWRKLASFDAYLGGKGAFTPLAFAPDGNLYVLSNAGSDKFALYTFDLKTNSISPKPLIALADYDFSGNLLTTRDKLLGVRYLSDAEASVWFDDAMKKNQAAVDALLPNTVNLIEVAARAASPWVLVSSYSDRQPLRYALYNLETGKLNPVGDTHPEIDPARMADQELLHYKARDGLKVPAWLTVPNGSKRKQLPLVVMVHGGPYVRGVEWGWSPQVQFLASRGYAVLEPEFRGSTGYGRKHYESGWKQWGLAMQNDIADGARWAIAEGIADPKRICIAGASYGGYAALMGLVNDPDLYKCAIDMFGVTDINLLYTGHWSFTSDTSADYRAYGMPTLVGDQVKDAAQLKATSPLVQAARIKQPLLLVYGAVDQRVPLYHGKQFFAAVQPHNNQVEWLVYEDEAHGWQLPKNKIDFWNRADVFLQRHIGKP